MAYNFTLYDKESRQFENYKITNRMTSRIAQLKEIEKQSSPFWSREIMVSVVTTTARISVEYSDYVKARHFIAMFDEWIKGCDESKANTIILFLKPISHLLRQFGMLLFMH